MNMKKNVVLPILDTWKDYFIGDRNEGIGSSYERIVLNIKLSELYQRYRFRSALEVPSFGFTGISGINSLWLTKKHGVDITLVDTDIERLEFIQQVWNEAHLQMQPVYTKNFLTLPFTDNAVDFSWNFASLWFVDRIGIFLNELTRVTRRLILIAVPNQKGFGYKLRKYLSRKAFHRLLRESYIVPENIISCMNKLKWRLVEWGYIDTPPWPDIAMKKEEFIKLLKLEWLFNKFSTNRKPRFYSIMEYYTGKEPGFEESMMRYMWMEKNAPGFVKYIWAHHKYFLFEPWSHSQGMS